MKLRGKGIEFGNNVAKDVFDQIRKFRKDPTSTVKMVINFCWRLTKSDRSSRIKKILTAAIFEITLPNSLKI